jgi:dienelactone hydrolase
MRPPSPAAQALAGYAQFSFRSGDIVHAVYHAGDPGHPPLLLLPELAGVAPGLLLFAARLRAAGFQVYLPWLFGPLGRRAPLKNALRLCISREFAYLRAGVSAPITRWLRELAGEIGLRNGDCNVGAIGMCLTGGFAIPLILNRKVTAAVAAQPSVPLSLLFAATGLGSGRGALNVSAEDIAAARTCLDTGAARLLAVRCRADRICPHEKLERLREEFPVGLETQEYGATQSRNALGDRPHALYTKEYRIAEEAPADHHSRQAFADLLRFLREHLPATPSGQQQAAARGDPGPQP